MAWVGQAATHALQPSSAAQRLAVTAGSPRLMAGRSGKISRCVARRVPIRWIRVRIMLPDLSHGLLLKLIGKSYGRAQSDVGALLAAPAGLQFGRGKQRPYEAVVLDGGPRRNLTFAHRAVVHKSFPLYERLKLLLHSGKSATNCPRAAIDRPVQLLKLGSLIQ